MHICQDEIFALLSCLPFIGMLFSSVRMRWRAWRSRNYAHCNHKHHEKP